MLDSWSLTSCSLCVNVTYSCNLHHTTTFNLTYWPKNFATHRTAMATTENDTLQSDILLHVTDLAQLSQCSTSSWRAAGKLIGAVADGKKSVHLAFNDGSIFQLQELHDRNSARMSADTPIANAHIACPTWDKARSQLLVDTVTLVCGSDNSLYTLQTHTQCNNIGIKPVISRYILPTSSGLHFSHGINKYTALSPTRHDMMDHLLHLPPHCTHNSQKKKHTLHIA